MVELFEQLVRLSQQLLREAINAGSAERRGLFRAVNVRVSRLHNQYIETGPGIMYHLAVQMCYLHLFSMVPSLIERFLQRSHVRIFRNFENEPNVLILRRKRLLEQMLLQSHIVNDIFDMGHSKRDSI